MVESLESSYDDSENVHGSHTEELKETLRIEATNPTTESDYRDTSLRAERTLRNILEPS